ncbi:MAG TPA: DUF1622 domain-containing protein [Chloroflexota bacterium]|nr:DUF1622 domain-containing protein [Chloroflexota bacterium]
MPPAEWLGFRTWSVVIQFGAALLISGYVVAALLGLVRTREITRARLVMADGVIAGLTLLVVAALLRLISLESWEDIGLFAAIFSLRTLLKRLFLWEEARLRGAPARPADVT